MSTYRHALPQLSDRIFLTDGGIETMLIYQEGLAVDYARRSGLLFTALTGGARTG
jgi:hypothetical protein